ncbi:MAG TPA: hypothetical protein VG675_08535 [Bryobacteraceae bacterium]|nr:hypothetical protein [Bryobacteraceae bacterium]
MPETPTNEAAEASSPSAGARSKDEVALELMKFIAVATGYGKSTQSATGFSGKPVARSAEEHADALLDLFERCRRVVNREDQGQSK